MTTRAQRLGALKEMTLMCSQMLGEPESPVVMQLVEMVAVLSAVLHEELSSETVAVPQSGEDT